MKATIKRQLSELDEKTKSLELSDKRAAWMTYIDNVIKELDKMFLAKKKQGKLKKVFSPDYSFILDDAPPWVFEDEELTLFAIDKRVINIDKVSETLKGNKEYIKKYFSVRNAYYFLFDEKLFLDKEIFLLAFNKNPEVYRVAYPLNRKYDADYFFEKPFILELVEKSPRVYEYLRVVDKQDRDILLKAIIGGVPLNLIKRPDAQKVLKDKEIALELMKQNPAIFPYLSNKIRSDRLFCESVIKPDAGYKDKEYYYNKHQNNLKYVGANLKNDKDFMKNYIFYVDFYNIISEGLRNDKELMLLFVKKNPVVYHLVENIIPQDVIYDIVLEELKAPGGYYIYKYLKPSWKEKIEVLYEYLKHFDSPRVRNDASNFNLIPKKIVEEIGNELNEYKIEHKLTWDYSNHSHYRDISLVDFARSKYLALYLNEQAKKNENKIENNKKLIKI